MMIRIRSITVLEKYRVHIELTNGEQKTIDLEPFLQGPIFEPLRNNPKLFRTVKVDKAIGTIVWQNGADIDPDVLIGKEKADWMKVRTKRNDQSTSFSATSVREQSTTYRTRNKTKRVPRSKRRSKRT